MADSRSRSALWRAAGVLLVLLGVAVFAVRLQHEGPYQTPGGRNLFGGIGALLLGAALLSSALPQALRWLALAATPFVLFSGLYAVMSELEEVVSLFATDSSGSPANLRLWVADHEGDAWVAMPLEKAREHDLDGNPAELLRDGETSCVIPVLHEDRASANAIFSLRQEKYAVQRFATAIGMFGAEAGPQVVALRLDPCPEGLD